MLGNTIQPASYRFSTLDRAHPADQNQEGRLQGIFGIMGVTQQPPADAEKHGTMPPHEKGEGTFVPIGYKSLQ